MNDLSIPYIDTHVAGIAHDVSGLCVCKSVYRRAHTSVCCGGVRQAHTKVIVNTHNKAGAVRAVGQACSAVHIGVTHKLTRKICHCRAHFASASRCNHRRLYIMIAAARRRGRGFLGCRFPCRFLSCLSLCFFPGKSCFLFRLGL